MLSDRGESRAAQPPDKKWPTAPAVEDAAMIIIAQINMAASRERGDE